MTTEGRASRELSAFQTSGSGTENAYTVHPTPQSVGGCLDLSHSTAGTRGPSILGRSLQLQRPGDTVWSWSKRSLNTPSTMPFGIKGCGDEAVGTGARALNSLCNTTQTQTAYEHHEAQFRAAVHIPRRLRLGVLESIVLRL